MPEQVVETTEQTTKTAKIVYCPMWETAKKLHEKQEWCKYCHTFHHPHHFKEHRKSHLQHERSLGRDGRIHRQ